MKTLADLAYDHIRNAAAYLERTSNDEYGAAINDLRAAFVALDRVFQNRSALYYRSDEYKAHIHKQWDEQERKRKTKKTLEARVAEWAEENLQVGDFVRFIGTRSAPWRYVQSIERTKFPEYHASRVHGSVIVWKESTIPFAAYQFTGNSSVNGMEKIDIVVRDGVEVFNRKSVHSSKKQDG